MDELLIYAVLIIFGLLLGSFAGASVWRLRARQLVEDKAEGENVDSAEYEQLLPLTKARVREDRSRCLHCEHPLAWYDLLPLVSWVSLGGKCRYCRTKIGSFEPLMEIGMATFFAASYFFWPLPLDSAIMIFYFIAWLIAGVLLIILFAYDLKWFLLPDVIVFPLIGIGGVMAIIKIVTAADLVSALVSTIGAVAILSGLYYLLHWISKGQWIGFGDVKLGLALSLLLADWQLAFIALFSANLLGCFIVIPAMLMKKLTRTTRVPFGPLLIIGAVIAMLGGVWLQATYIDAMQRLTALLLG